MSGGVPIAPAEISLSQDQLDDFARLLARCLVRGNIEWLARKVLGPEALQQALQQAGNDPADTVAFARIMAQALQDGRRISDAMLLLRQEGLRNSWLTLGLNRILTGNRLGDDASLQKFVNDYEPFISSAAIQERLPKVMRTVCAVALGKPIYEIVGSGFLIAPDLVLTNYHVIEPFLEIDLQTKEIKQGAPGEQIFFFFDYLSAPAPNVPPVNGEHTNLCVTAAKDWLVFARQFLSGDGTATPPNYVNKEYDYAVIRLARPVGDRPTRTGGGVKRGWLPLPEDQFDVLGKKKRIIVFQHPQKAPQQFDIGDYIQLDPSATRVWYSVSTAHGSSGGAAVDSDGKLFALHNAEVNAAVAAPLGKRLNQGIRIDKIVEDLKVEAPHVLEPPPQTDDSLLFWSLNDDARNSLPIIGRTDFRNHIAEMTTTDTERVLVVTGPPESGLHFSIKLLRHTLGIQVPVAEFSPAEISLLEPRLFLSNLLNKLEIKEMNAMPAEPATESLSGWLRQDLPQWLLQELVEDAKNNPSKYPAWVIINTVTPPDSPLLWAKNLEDLIAALAGVRSSGHTPLDLPQLRWLFLSFPSILLPVSGVKKRQDCLEKDDSYPADFAECMRLAYYSIDKNAILPELILKNMAGLIEQNNQKLSQGDRLSLRKALANSVRELIKNDPQTGGGGN